MDFKELFDTCREILSEELEIDKILIIDEALLQETLGLDSLDYVDIVVLVEEQFGIILESKDFEGVRTFGDFCRMLHSKIESLRTESPQSTIQEG